jgi:hypothetical protein
MKNIALAAIIAMLSPLAEASTITFDKLNATGGSVSGTTLANYLATFGVVITDVSAGAVVTVQDENVIYGGGTVAAPSSPNIITAGGGAGISYTISFANPQVYFEFTRAELKAATSSGVSHPEWTATALDAKGNTLATVSEPLMASSSTIPAATYKLMGTKGTLIAAVVIYGNDEGFAGFASPVLDNWVVPNPVPVAGTVEGLSGPTVVCDDLTTGQSVTSPLSTNGAFTLFNCDEAGLSWKKGDSITMTISGTALH